MATNGNRIENQIDEDEREAYILKRYLSGSPENDDDIGWRQRDGDEPADDHDDQIEDYAVNDRQLVPKNEPGLEAEEEQNNVQPEAVMDDAEPEEQDPLDDVDPEVSTNHGDEAEFEESEGPEDLAHVKDEPPPPSDPTIWTLPADKDTCTLDEIRRGQVINRVAPNECPVKGCGKKINEMRAEPSPGTISSGLRTHVLFVHYAMTCKRVPKKRKLDWPGKRRDSASPKKQYPTSHAHNNDLKFDPEPENFAMPTNDIHHPSLSGASLIQRISNQNRSSPPGSILNKKIKQLSANNFQPQQHQHQSSLQSLMQATGIGFGANNGSRFSPQSKQKGQDLSASQKSFNQTTSSLFSILAGLTQQPQHNQNQLQQSQNNQQQTNHRANLSLTSSSQAQPSRNAKPAHGANTLSLSQCSRNGNSNNFMNNQPISSSLLTLLNEKISGNVANSLQSQLKKSLDSNNRIPATSNSRVNSQTNNNNNNQYYQSNSASSDNHTYNSTNNPILNSLNINNGDSRQTNGENGLSSLSPFIELIAKKTGSNIGPGGVAETKKIIEKFVTWLMYSSQTIADHYIAPYAGEAPQQKPEISASDVILAYKMMQKSQPQ